MNQPQRFDRPDRPGNPSGQSGESGQPNQQAGKQPGQPGNQAGQPSQQPGNQPGQPGQGGQPGGQGSGGQPGGDQPDGQGNAAQQAMEALMQAAESQAQAMAQSRAAGLQPGQKPVDNGQPAPGGSGNMPSQELVQAGDPPKLGELPDLKRMSAEDWAKLPPKVAEQLLESQREAMSSEFRQQINNYFRIIAERGRRNATPPAQEK